LSDRVSERFLNPEESAPDKCASALNDAQLSLNGRQILTLSCIKTMQDDKRAVVRLERPSELAPRVADYYAMMEKTREKLIRTVQGLETKQIDFTPTPDRIESIGTLLFHIAAVEWAWIFQDIGGQEMDYELWKHGFALREGIPQIRGNDISFYLERLNKVRDAVFNRLKSFSDNQLGNLVEVDDDIVSVEWILFHLIEHEAIHIGQASVLLRLMERAL
jgi:uncharacterized damage-inducible protein DinB